MGVIKRLPATGFTCYMCKISTVHGAKYVYRTFDFSPKNPPREFDICTKCAIRESKFKKKDKLDKFLGEE